MKTNKNGFLADNQFVCGDNADLVWMLEPGSVAAFIQSPPYDNMRDYNGRWAINFDKLIEGQARALMPGGVVVWIVRDATIEGGETGTSFRQALRMMGSGIAANPDQLDDAFLSLVLGSHWPLEQQKRLIHSWYYARQQTAVLGRFGLRLHDTMFMRRTGSQCHERTRYYNTVEYMFVFSKGRPRAINLIKDRRNKHQKTSWGHKRHRTANGAWLEDNGQQTSNEFGIRWHIWDYTPGGTTAKYQSKHPAILHWRIARDHIIGWTNAGDLVIDAFAGSGTVCFEAAALGRRWIGFDINADYIKEAKANLAFVNKGFALKEKQVMNDDNKQYSINIDTLDTNEKTAAAIVRNASKLIIDEQHNKIIWAANHLIDKYDLPTAVFDHYEASKTYWQSPYNANRLIAIEHKEAVKAFKRAGGTFRPATKEEIEALGAND